MSTAQIWHRLPSPDIRAEQYTGDNFDALVRAFDYGPEGISRPADEGADYLIVRTAQGDWVPLRPGDYVIAEEIPGRFYPCERAIFEKRHGKGPSA